MLSTTRRRTVGALAALGLVAAAAPASAQVSAPAQDAATFVSYTAPGQLAREAGEPTLGVNWNTGKVLYQAFTETDQITFDDSVFPATASWKDVSRPPTSITSLDPFLYTDEITGRTLVSQLAPPCSIAAFTDSDGEPTATNPNGYSPSAACGVGANFDHQTVHYGKAVRDDPTSTYRDAEGNQRVAWYCSQVVLESSCAVSRDGGVTFPKSRPVYTFKGDLFTDDQSIVGCEGLHGHLNTSPVDGTAYLPNFACNSADDPATEQDELQIDKPSVVVSPDEGENWTIRQVPDATSPNFDADPAVDVDGGDRAYVAYESADSRVFAATTTDRGETWTPSQDLGAPFGLKNATVPTVIAGSEDRAAVAFLGTPTEAPLNTEGVPENQLFDFDPDGDDPKAGWHLYVAMTYDGGTSWTTTDLTPDDPVQRGCFWWGSAQDAGEMAECDNDKRNLLDFIDITIDEEGRVLVGWADGCVGRCVTEGHTRQTNTIFADRPEQDADLTQAEFRELYSQEDIGVITRQSCGKGLLAEFDDAAEGPLETCAAATGAEPEPDALPVGGLQPRAIDDSCPRDRVPMDSRQDDDGNTHEFAIDCMVWWEIAKGTSGELYEPGVPVDRAQMASFIARLVEKSGGELMQDPPDAFDDDNGFTPHEVSINRLAAAGIIDGKGDRRYDPTGTVTRAQMAKFIVNGYEFRSGKALEAPRDYFTDDAASQHQDDINRSAAAGFTAGRGADRYEPDADVLRDQMASFLSRVLDLLVQEGTTPPKQE